MHTISRTNTTHDFTKKNLVTLSDKTGCYDLLECRSCGLIGKSYRLNVVLIDGRISLDRVDKCPGYKHTAQPNVGRKVKVTFCSAGGGAFKNLTPGSVHVVIDTPDEHKEEDHRLPGVWVMGVGEPVKLLRGEFVFVENED